MGLFDVVLKNVRQLADTSLHEDSTPLIAFSGCEWYLIYKLHYAAADLILEVLGLTLLMLVKMDEISLSIINFEIVVDKDIYTVVKLIITLE